MSKWQDKTDFEINKAVAWLNWKGSTVSMSDTSMPMSSCEVCNGNMIVNANFDPCNNSSDAWSIILENKISIEFRYHKSLNPIAKRFGSNSHNIADKNPLRAAMIVYLEINGVKP